MRDKFEYKCVFIRGNYQYEDATRVKPLEDKFNELGVDGWELINFSGTSYFIFKRKILEDN